MPAAIATPTLQTSAEAASPGWLRLADGAMKTIVPVVLGQQYAAPQNDRVRVLFSSLPASPGKLRINEVHLTAGQVRQSGALSDIAYDITSTMADGSFSYDLTLPLPEPAKGKPVETIGVKSASSADGLQGAQLVTQPKEKAQDSITIRGLNHFTIFVVTTDSPALSIQPCVDAGASSEGGLCFNTIQEAINEAMPGGTIEVKVGVYSESVNVNKSVTLKGAQANIPAADPATGTPRSGDESAVKAFNITASEVTLNGFSLTNPGVQVNVSSATTLSGVKLENNLFSGYASVGLPTSNAGNILISDNLFTSPAAGAGSEAMQIKANSDVGGCNGTKVLSNVFSGATNNGGADVNFTCTGSNSTGVTVSDNLESGNTEETSFVAFSGITGDIQVTGNRVTKSTGSAIFFWGGVTGTVDIKNNSITGGSAKAISIQNMGSDYGGDHSGKFTISNNNLSGNNKAVSLGNAFASSATVTISGNDLSGAVAKAVDNGATISVDATNNRWGNLNGPTHPSNAGGNGATVSNGVTFTPWLGDGKDTSTAIGFQPNATPKYALPTRLVFSTQPGGAEVNTALSPQPVVQAQDAGGNLGINFGGTVALVIGNNPSNGSLSGTIGKAATGGVATFSGLSINNGGDGYTLIASSTGLNSVTSSGFNISNPTATVTPVPTAPEGPTATATPVPTTPEGPTATATPPPPRAMAAEETVEAAVVGAPTPAQSQPRRPHPLRTRQ